MYINCFLKGFILFFENKMFIKLFYLILILKLAQGRYAFVPKFYGQDSAIIVDTDKVLQQSRNAPANFGNKIRMAPSFPLWRQYPRYHIIPPPSPGQIMAVNTWAKAVKSKPDTTISTTHFTSTTTSTATPKISISSSATDDEFPPELLYIAQNNLGLKSIDEIPSISELSELLGTDSPEKTLKYIKLLISNERGIDLLKAYIESTDYTDNTGDSGNKNYILENEQEEDDDEIDDVEQPLKANDDDLVVIADEESNDDYVSNEEEQMENNSPKIVLTQRIEPKIVQLETLPKNNPSFMERITDYMHLNNLFHKSEENTENEEYNKLNRMTENGKTVAKKVIKLEEVEENQTSSEININTEAENLKTPILIREPIPYNYPVPIRFQTTSSTSTPAPIPNTPVVYLNSPKIRIPHLEQLSRITKIPSKQIEDFLATKPKLLELATKISQFPISYDRQSPIEAQVIAAVHKAFEQDEDLKNLLSSTATLK